MPADVIDHESLLHRFRVAAEQSGVFSAAETRFTLKTVDRSCFERPPARYVNARQLISNSRPNGLRVYMSSTTYIKHSLCKVSYNFSPRFIFTNNKFGDNNLQIGPLFQYREQLYLQI